jgi:hypothetical protein
MYVSKSTVSNRWEKNRLKNSIHATKDCFYIIIVVAVRNGAKVVFCARNGEELSTVFCLHNDALYQASTYTFT